MDKFHVLMYHEIIKKEDFDRTKYLGIKVASHYQDVLPQVLFAFLEEFEKQMEYLHTNGYVTLKLKDVEEFYYNDKPLPEKSVLLNFDDMYKSVIKHVYPILKKYNFNAVGFVVLDWIFDEQQDYSTEYSVCMSKAELNTMRDVFEYANHTKALHTRKEDKTALQLVDRNTLSEDIKRCNEFVDVKNAFAYPFGVYTDEVINWLKELNFLLGFTSEGGANLKATDPLKIKRDGVLLHYDLEQFKKILS